MAKASNHSAPFRGDGILNPADALAVQSLVTAYFQRTDRPGTGGVADPIAVGAAVAHAEAAAA